MGTVRYEFLQGAAWLTLTAGDAGNRLDQKLAQDLLGAVRRARADEARVVVLRAEGRAFCVGGDVSSFAAAVDREQMVEDLAETVHRTISDLHRMDAIVVCAVQGVAAGAGVALAAAADLVLAGSSARFTLAYTKIGLSPDAGSSLLSQTLGLHRTLHLALLNPTLSGEQAHVAGLVLSVHPDAELDAAVRDVVAQLLAGSRTAQVAAKRLVREQATPWAEAAMRRETLSIRACAASADGQEGFDAFLRKRRPDFPSARA